MSLRGPGGAARENPWPQRHHPEQRIKTIVLTEQRIRLPTGSVCVCVCEARGAVSRFPEGLGGDLTGCNWNI